MRKFLSTIILFMICIGTAIAIIPTNHDAYAMYESALYFNEIPQVFYYQVSDTGNVSSVAVQIPVVFDAIAMAHGGMIKSVPQTPAYQSAIDAYAARGLKIPNATEVKHTLMGLDNKNDHFNSGIGVQTKLLAPGAELLSTYASNKYNLQDVIGVVSITRSYENDDGATPIYTVSRVSWIPGDLGRKYYATTRDLDEAYRLYESQLEPNLIAWEQ